MFASGGLDGQGFYGRYEATAIQLEDAGLITSDWFVGQSGPGRRVYEIAPSGRESLDRSVTGVLGLQRLIAEYEVRARAIARPGRSLPVAHDGGAAPSPAGDRGS